MTSTPILLIMIFLGIQGRTLKGSGSDELEILVKVPHISYLSHLPPPPTCDEHLDRRPEQTLENVTLWTLNAGTSVGTGLVVSKWAVRTSCTVYFFGAEEKRVISEGQLPCDDDCFQLGASRDPLLRQSVYQCRWTGTMEHETEVLRVSTPELFPSRDNHLVADGRIWTEDKGFWTNGLNRMQVTLTKRSCPFTPVRTETAIKLTHENNSVTFILPKSSLFLRTHSSDHAMLCLPHEVLISPTDSVYFLSASTQGNHSLSSVLDILRPRLSAGFSKVNYNLYALTNALDSDLLSVSLNECKAKQYKYVRALRSGVSGELGYLLTGDPHSSLVKRGNSWALETHTTLTIRVVLSSLTRLNSTTAKAQDDSGNNIQVHYISGITGAPPQEDSINPLLPLANGSYINVMTHHSESGLSYLTFSPWAFSPIDVFSPDAELEPIRPHYQSDPVHVVRTNIFSDIWEWATSWVSAAKVVGLTIGVLILIYIARKTWRWHRLRGASDFIA